MTFFNKESIPIIILARGGSKRIPRKNICVLDGKPLIHHSIDAILKATLPVHIYISTDCPNIAQSCSSFPSLSIVSRPPSLASDSSSSEDALLHALKSISVNSSLSDWFLLVSACSPLLSTTTIDQVLLMLPTIPIDIECIMTVTETREDLWSLSSDGTLVRLFPNAPRQQQLRSSLFIENSALYALRTKAFIAAPYIHKLKSMPLVISSEESLDINEPSDLHLAQFLLNKRSTSI